MAASAPANLVLVLLVSAMIGHSSATWCVCKEGSDQILQKTLDYACGAGADCNPIHQNGVCWNPNTVRAHCSYAVNSFFQKKGQAPGTCDFAGTAAMSTTDPSANGCVFPASGSGTGSSTTSSSTSTSSSSSSTGIGAGTGTGTGSTSAYNGTPGVFGTGMGPSGMNTDLSHGGSRIEDTVFFSLSLAMFAWSSMLLWRM